MLNGWLLNGRVGGNDQTTRRGRKLSFELCTGFPIKGKMLFHYYEGNHYLPRFSIVPGYGIHHLDYRFESWKGGVSRRR